MASVAITSLTFMLLDVPEPVWNTSIGKWSSQSPRATSSAAAMIASATSSSTTPSSALTLAAAALMRAERLDVGALEGVPRDREVLDRPLGLSPPLRVARDPDLTHGVVLDPETLVVALLAHLAPRRRPLASSATAASVGLGRHQSISRDRILRSARKPISAANTTSAAAW